MSAIRRVLPAILLTAAAVAAASCGSDASDGAVDAGTPAPTPTPEDAGSADAGSETGSQRDLGDAYLFATDVTQADVSHRYVQVLSKLEGEVELARALEIPGSSSVFSKLGAVFIANAEDMTVTRYEVEADAKLTQGKRFGMSGVGVSAFVESLFFVLDAQRAYYIDGSGRQIVVWNPTTMEITQTVPLLDLQRNGFEGSVVGYNEPSTWLLEQKGMLYLPVAWTNFDALTAEPVVALLEIDAKDPTQQKLHVSDCAAVSDEGMVLGRDGNIYLAGTNQWDIFRRFGKMPEGALTKFDLSTKAFDPTYCRNLAQLTGGHIAGTLIAYAPGEFVLRAVDEALVPPGDSGSYYQDIANACRFYHGSIDEKGQLAVVEEPKLGTSPHYCWGWVHKIDGSPYFWGEDTMFKWDGAGMVPMFKATGFATAFQRIR